MRKKTHQEFVNEISIKNPNVEILSTYVNSRTKISCKCKICGHKWDVLPTSLSRGHGCQICGIEKIRRALSFNTNEFKEKLYIVNPNIIIISEYTSSHDRICCKCMICGYEFTTYAYYLLNGKVCPKCAAKDKKHSGKLSNDLFMERLNKYNPNVEPLEEYKGRHVKILCLCKIHNREWRTYPGELYNGSGCPECCSERLHKALSLSQDDFVIRLEKVNPDIEVLGEYINNQTNIECRCKKCGYVWYPKPNNLLYGKTTGCPKCQSYSKGEDRIQEYLESNHIQYTIHKTYPDLLGIGGKKLSFDFYLHDYNLLVEYQGQQHENPTTFGNMSVEDARKQFETQQEHDRRKYEYAKTHGINMLEIWYYNFNNINQILNDNLNINNTKRTA